MNDALRQSAETGRWIGEMRLKQQQIDLANRADRRAQEEYDLSMGRAAPDPEEGLDLRNRLMQELRLRNQQLNPQLRVPDWKVNQNVMDALTAVRAAHSDLDLLMPALSIIAGSIRADWARLTIPEYIESLYAIAKYARFAAPARSALLAPSTQERK